MEQWKLRKGVLFSEAAFERRSEFFLFVCQITDPQPEIIALLPVEDTVDVVLEFALHASAYAGAGLWLLQICCQARPEFLAVLLDRLSCMDGGSRRVQAHFRVLWNAIADPVPASGSVFKAKTVLKPEAFRPAAIALLSSITQARDLAVQWLLQCNALVEILSWLLMDLDVKMKNGNKLAHVGADLLELIQRLVLHQPDCRRYFMADPRYLNGVFRKIFSTKVAVQLAAIKLTLHLLEEPRMLSTLYGIEHLSGRSLGPVEHWMSECLIRTLGTGVKLREKDALEIGTLLQVPLFLDLRTPEVVELSLSCMKSQVVEDDALMILPEAGLFNTIPAWMYMDTGKVEWIAAMQRTQLIPMERAFSQAIEARKPQQVTLYKIPREGYFRSTSARTRERISHRITEMWMRRGARKGMAARSLLHRLSRFLLEDRAELIRSVALARGIRECDIDVQSYRLGDTLSLLKSCVLFSHVHPDQLAALAFAMGNPTRVELKQEVKLREIPIMLFHEEIGYKILNPETGIVATGHVMRGQVFGFPEWMWQDERDLSNVMVCFDIKFRVLVTPLPKTILDSNLGPGMMTHLTSRCVAVTKTSNPNTVAKLGHTVEPTSRSVLLRRDLELHSMKLLHRLLQYEEYRTFLLNDEWLLQTLVDVATSAFHPDLVHEATSAIVTLLEDPDGARKICDTTIWLTRSDLMFSQMRQCYSQDILFFRALANSFAHWHQTPEVLGNFFSILHRLLVNLPALQSELDVIWPADLWEFILVLFDEVKLVGRQMYELLKLIITHCRHSFDRACHRFFIHIKLVQGLESKDPSLNSLAMEVFAAMCDSDEIRTEIWRKQININTFEHIIRQIAADLPSLAVKIEQRNGQQASALTLRLYCRLLNLICSSEVDEALDRAYSKLVQEKYMLLTILLRHLEDFELLKNVLLRCIGSICVGVPENCIIAQRADVGRGQNRCKFVEYIIQRTERLPRKSSWIDDAEEMEALFLCVQALSCSRAGAESFTQTGFFSSAIELLDDLPPSPTDEHLRVWRALIFCLHNLVSFVPDVVVATALNFIDMLVTFFNRMSAWLLEAKQLIRLGRVLRDFARFLSFLVRDESFRLRLYDKHFSAKRAASSNTSSFSFFLFGWIMVAENTGDESASPIPEKVAEIHKDLEVESLGVLTNLCLESGIALVLSTNERCVEVIRHIFSVLRRSSLVDAKRATAYLRFLCFMLEHWSMREDVQAALGFLEQFPIQMLIDVVQNPGSAGSRSYALRLLWLLEALSASASWDDKKFLFVSGGSLGAEKHYLLKTFLAMSDMLLSTSPCVRDVVNVLGLSAEMVENKIRWRDCWDSEAMKAIATFQESVWVYLQPLAADWSRVLQLDDVQSLTSSTAYAAIHWKDGDDDTSTLGLVHQSLRLVSSLHKHTFSTFDTWSFPTAQDLAGESVLRGALAVMVAFNGSSGLWIDVVEKALFTIEGMFLSITRRIELEHTSPAIPHGPERVRWRYMLCAKKLQFLCQIVRVLGSSVTEQLFVQVLLTGVAFMEGNVQASLETRHFSDQGVELMEVLLRHTAVEAGPDVQYAAVRFLGAIVKHNPSAARVAASVGVLNRLLQILESTMSIPPELELFQTEVLTCLVLLTRQLPRSYLSEKSRKCLSISFQVLEYPLRDSQVHLCAKLINEMLRDSRTPGLFVELWSTSRGWLHSFIQQSHSRLAQTVVCRLFANADLVSLVSADKMMLRDLFMRIMPLDVIYFERVRLLRDLLNITSTRETPVVDAFLSELYEQMTMLRLHERVVYLHILPSAISSLLPKATAFWWKGKHWKVILETCLACFRSSLLPERMAAHCALQALFHCRFLYKLPEATFVLRTVAIQWIKEMDAVVGKHVEGGEIVSDTFAIVPLVEYHASKPTALGADKDLGMRKNMEAQLIRKLPVTITVAPDELLLLLSNTIDASTLTNNLFKGAQVLTVLLSMWAAISCCGNNVGDADPIDLVHLAMRIMTKATTREPSSVPPAEMKALTWQLNRVAYGSARVSERVPVQRLLLRLARGDDTVTSDKAAALLQNASALAGHDWAERVNWDLCALTSRDDEPRDARTTAINTWCELLSFVCTGRRIARSVIDWRLLRKFFFEVNYHIVGAEMLSMELVETYLGLALATIRWVHEEGTFQDTIAHGLKSLAQFCVSSLVLPTDFSNIHRFSVHLLFYLSSCPVTLPLVLRAFGLDINHQLPKATRTVSLHTITSILDVSVEEDIACTSRCIFVVFQLCQSPLGVGPLIRSRRHSNFTMTELITVVLLNSIGTLKPLKVRSKPETWSSPSSFLVSTYTPDEISAGTYALKTLLCLLTDHDSFDAIRGDSVVILQLFAALACTTPSIAQDAALALARCIKTFIHARNDDTKVETNLHDLFAYYVHSDTSKNYYRRLAFFNTIRDERIVNVVPPTTFPGCFVILTLWIQFFSTNIHLITDDESVNEESRERSIHEDFLLSLIDIMLYVLCNYFSQVFDVSTALPSEIKQHTALCSALFEFCRRTDNPEKAIVTDELIRSKSLLLIHLLCSFDMFRYSIEFFLRPQLIEEVLVIIESTTSPQEQLVAVRLLRDVTSYGAIKDMFVVNTYLLKRIIAWMETPVFPELRGFAAAIARNLVTKSADQAPRTQLLQNRKSIFEFVPTFEDQLARSLFQRDFANRSDDKRRPSLTFSARNVCIQVAHCPDQEAPTTLELQFPLTVTVHTEFRNDRGAIVREAKYKGRLGASKAKWAHRCIVEDDISCVACHILINPRNDASHKRHGRYEHPAADATIVGESTSSSWTMQGQFSVTVEDHPIVEVVEDLGAVGRLLRRDDLTGDLLEHSAGIVAELCKNHVIFCNESIRLWSHVLSVLSVSLASNKEVDFSCLECLSSWFWSKSSVSFFVESMKPILTLIQAMRRHSYVVPFAIDEDVITASVDDPYTARQARIRNINGASQTAPTKTHRQNFLTSLMEWVGAVETRKFTEHCINVLFCENVDVLLFLCSYYFPGRGMRASFFYLVEVVIRSNLVQCEAFARKHAIRLLLRVLRLQVGKEYEESRAEMLQHATRVVVKLTRSPRARQKFLAHGGFEFFGSIARDIFLAKWRMGAFPRAAAQNVVLACSFMCEFLVAVPTLEVSAPVNRVLQASYETASSKGQLVELVVLLLNHSSYPFHRATDRTELEVLVQNFNDQRRSDSLSILETLVLFLSQLNGKPVACFDSFDRLAATILAALAEKLPSRVAFEYSALMMLDRVTTRPAFTSKNQAQERVELRQMYLTGLRRCLKLTKWAFESDLTVIRRTYLAWICEGVRTGVVPAECRNVCRNFDRGFLVDEELVKTSASSSTMPSMASMGQSANDRRGEGLTRSGSVDNGERIKHDEEALLAELQELVEFVEQHEQVVKTLTENRKKSMNGDIQAADTSARVLCAMHSTLSIALDWYVDVLDSQKQSGDNPGDRVEAIERFQTWLKLMEELGGVLCCRLHDLDREYYSGLIDKFHAQITEFPAFLQKAEGRQSRGQSVVLFFWNLNSILKRIINKHELKGVAANDFLLAGEAKRIYDLLREQEAMMLSTVSELLQSKQAQDQMVRLIISMNYVWQRVVGSATISESLAGVKSSVGLLATIKKYFFNLIAVLLHPLPFLRSKWEHLHELLGKLAAYFGPAEHHALDSTGSSARVLPDAAGETSTEHEARIDRKTSIVHISTVPFTSNELLLDHFGFASLSAKKTKQLLNLNEVKEGVLEDLRATLNKSVDSLTQLSVIQLDKEYQSLSPDMLYTLITSLRQRVNATDSGIEVPVVQREAFDVNFWRFLIRPVQRARLFNLYYLVQNFINEDADGRGGLMDEHQQHLLTEIHGHRKQAVTPLMPIRSFRSTSTFLRQGSTIGLVMKGQSVGGTATSRSKTGKRLKLHAIRRFYMAYLSREALRRRLAIFTDSNNADTSVVRATSEFITDAMLHVCDHITAVDPFSDAMAIELLRRTVLIHRRTSTALELEDLVPSTLEDWISRIKGCIPDRIRSFHIQVSARVSRNAKVLLLMLAFWRHEELEADLNNKSLAKVFNNDERERKDYFVSFHLRKAFAELIRVWMPESGTLGIPFWHSPWYSLGGGLLCFLIAVVLPLGYTDAELRYRHMNVVLFVHVGVVFALCAISIIIIALKHFVLQERNRLRLTPITTYYSNGLAIVAIMVEIVQLNSLSFDSTIKWNDTDQIPKLIQLLGNTGITNFGISQVTLKALVCFLTLLVWFILLKCANKFQKNGFLNRLLTKDLPSILNGMLYMGMISIFFSFLACVDCQGRNSALFDRCVENPKQVPFLLNHQLIECWSREHMLYALLGLWGITFFLPIGLLAQGMSQVLFQQEILDVKYAPLVLLMGQLIKAFTATAKAFFSFDPLLLASIGLGGNALLLLMMLLMKSTSIWFIKYIKCGIYSASCWSACCAILRLQSTSYSARSMNLIYIGWLSIGAITAATIMWNVYRRGEIAHKEQVDEWETQRRLMISITRQDAALTYTRGEARFMTEAKKRATKPSIRSSEFMRKAGKLSVDEPPQELDDFVRRAKTFASTGRLDGGKVASKHEVAIMTASNARFMQNARRLAKKIETNELRESEIEALNNKKTK